MPFRYLSILEGKEVTDVKDIKHSRKHLWAEMVFDEETFKNIMADRAHFEEDVQRAVSWYWAYRKELNEEGLLNREIERIIEEGMITPYRLSWSEWMRYRRIFFKAWNTFSKNLLKEL